MTSLQPAQRALKRLLANGPLTAIPKRPADQELLARLAAAQLDPRKTYGEADINSALEAWLEAFTQPFGLDHVTLRRMLVDYRLVTRTTSGSRYRVDPEHATQIEALREVEPAAVLREVRRERERRKREHTPG